MKKMKAIDLFCGVGGSSLGFKLSGFEIVLGVDIDRTTLSAYHANHPEVEILRRDILDLSAGDLPEADVILGSTPCTSFSVGNRYRTCDMTLTNKFLEIVKDYNPRYYMLENVPPIAKYLPKGVSYNMLCAANYGVPQKRKRCIGGNYPIPDATHAKNGKTLSNWNLKPWVKFGKIKSGNGAKPISKRGLAGAFRRTNEMGKKGNNFVIQFVDDDDVLPTFTSTSYHGLRASSAVIYDRGFLRQLSWIECVRAQSFPDNYIFRGTQAQKYRQLGDAVPPLLAKAIAGAIRDE